MTKAELRELKSKVKRSRFLIHVVRKAECVDYILCTIPAFLVTTEGRTLINSSTYFILESLHHNYDIRTLNFEVESPKSASKEDKKMFELHFKKTLFSFINK